MKCITYDMLASLILANQFVTPSTSEALIEFRRRLLEEEKEEIT